ncbi:YciE/YciF ferroxidase family protein [Flammeovirga aprica]|uniref:DUF892 family protein n=1 Tax=Flammeovirga aprica JL-4 TaxID=694437 RepID=A0A7X9P3Y0_9BACT|nr:DUF892 family protein [Flammeovirga aprica]NME68384.1 DUF892 family protein [Flammeovirga aprica JL-4]
MKQFEDLRDLFIHQMKDRYDSETQQIGVYHELGLRVKSVGLKRVLAICEKSAQKHIDFLDELFTDLHENQVGDICECSLGMIKEMNKVLENTSNHNITDIAILSTIRQLHSNDLTGYQNILMYADQVHDDAILDVLKQMLKNEKDLDQLLDETMLNLIQKEHVLEVEV